MNGGDQNHLRRNGNLVQHESLDLVIVDSLVFLSWQNPKADTHFGIEIFFSCKNAVAFVSDLTNLNLLILLHLYLILIEDNVKHFLELGGLLLIFSLSEDDHFSYGVGHKHFPLSISMKVGILIQLQLLVTKQQFPGM